MTTTEKIVGWIYVFIHMFALVLLLNFLNSTLFPAIGFTLEDKWINLIYYATGFVFLLVFMFNFWRESFGDLCQHITDTLIAVLVGYIAYILLSYLVNLILSFILDTLTNPNSAAASSMTKLNPNTMLAIGVFLAPVVEETLFRGVVFGSLRERNIVLAYVVSSFLFSVYHLWEYMVYRFDPVMLLYLLQYLPGGIVLAAVYEKGQNIWCPVFLHMIINYVSLSITIG